MGVNNTYIRVPNPVVIVVAGMCKSTDCRFVLLECK